MTTVSTQELAATSNPNEAATSGTSFDMFTEIQISEIVNRNASRSVKENQPTRERWTLNRSKLFSACCAEIKSLAGQHTDKATRIPAELAELVEKCIDNYLLKRINMVTPQNVVSAAKSFRHDYSNLRVVEAVVVRGENIISLKEQHLGIVILLGQAKKRLTTLQEKKTPDFDAEKNCKLTIAKMELTMAEIEANMTKQGIVWTK